MDFSQIFFNPSNPAGYSSIYKLSKKTEKSRQKTLDWLSGQDAYTLHKRRLKKFPRRKTMVRGIDDQWQMDLVDMTKYARYNTNYKFLLTAIDVFSRFAFAVPLKNKTGTEVVKGLTKLFVNRMPRRIQADRGSEFYNLHVRTFLSKRNIPLFSTYNEPKAAMVERFNRTLKERMFRFFTKENTYRYIEVLPHLLFSYNNSVHRITKTKPSEVTEHNQDQIWERLYKKELQPRAAFRFKVGDVVRLSKIKNKFEKGYTPNWTEEYFYVAARRGTHPVTYKIKDDAGEILEGSFYEPELQLIRTPTEYPIDVIKSRKLKNNKSEHYVHFRGWPDSFNQWIPAENLL